jgi:hypothetical protein
MRRSGDHSGRQGNACTESALSMKWFPVPKMHAATIHEVIDEYAMGGCSPADHNHPIGPIDFIGDVEDEPASIW